MKLAVKVSKNHQVIVKAGNFEQFFYEFCSNLSVGFNKNTFTNSR